MESAKPLPPRGCRTILYQRNSHFLSVDFDDLVGPIFLTSKKIESGASFTLLPQRALKVVIPSSVATAAPPFLSYLDGLGFPVTIFPETCWRDLNSHVVAPS